MKNKSGNFEIEIFSNTEFTSEKNIEAFCVHLRCQGLRTTVCILVHPRKDSGAIVLTVDWRIVTVQPSWFHKEWGDQRGETKQKKKKKNQKRRRKSCRKEARDRERGTEIPMTAKQALLDSLASLSATLNYISLFSSLSHSPSYFPCLPSVTLLSDNEDHYLLLLYRFYYFSSYVGRPLFFHGSLDFSPPSSLNFCFLFMSLPFHNSTWLTIRGFSPRFYFVHVRIFFNSTFIILRHYYGCSQGREWSG